MTRFCGLKSLLVLGPAVVGAGWGAAGAEPAEPVRTGQVAARLDTQVRVTMDYLLFLPQDYASGDRWPLMLFLHGAGERGDDLERVKKHGPPKIVETKPDFPFVLVSPQCPEGQWWEPVSLTALLDAICARYKIDEDRIYVTGLSMGGFGTWSLAAQTPDRFAAIVPICGGGEPYWARRFPHLAVWAFHGGQDRVVPVERSQEMVDALRRAGGDPKLTIYPEAGHDAWTKTYDNPELYQWLLQQKRNAPGRPPGRRPQPRRALRPFALMIGCRRFRSPRSPFPPAGRPLSQPARAPPVGQPRRRPASGPGG